MKSIKAKQVVRLLVVMIAALGIAAVTGCENTPTANNTNVANSQSSPASATQSPGTSATNSKPSGTGTISINPNPIKVCDKSGVGVTEVSWTLVPGTLGEVRVGSPGGTLFVQAGGPGTKATGKWVGNGVTFYLQNVSNGLPLTAENTIAKVAATTTSEGCP